MVRSLLTNESSRSRRNGEGETAGKDGNAAGEGEEDSVAGGGTGARPRRRDKERQELDRNKVRGREGRMEIGGGKRKLEKRRIPVAGLWRHRLQNVSKCVWDQP